MRSGDTLIVIAFYHKVTVDGIKQLNGLTSNSILPGQKLLIAVVTVQPTPTVTPQMTATPSNTPGWFACRLKRRARLPSFRITGSLCVIAYNDANGNARNDSEPSLPNVRVTLSDGNKPLDGYVTTATDKPRCFEQIAPGKYTVTVAAPAGFTATTTSESTVQVEAGKSVTLVFGLTLVTRSDPAPTLSTTTILVIFLGVVVMFMVVMGVAVVVLAKRNSERKSFMRSIKSILSLLAVAAVLWLAILPVAASPRDEVREAPQAQSNLLTNGSFDADINGWATWSLPPSGGDAPCTRRTPTYQRATEGRRVQAGSGSIQLLGAPQSSGDTGGTFFAGIQQTVNVTAGKKYKFTVWATSWFSTGDNPAVSEGTGSTNIQVGIGQGATYSADPNVTRSGLVNAKDTFQQLNVEVTASGTQLTVFTYANPDSCAKHTEVFFDSASLTEVGAAPTAAPNVTPPTAGPTSPPPRVGGQTPHPHTQRRRQSDLHYASGCDDH